LGKSVRESFTKVLKRLINCYPNMNSYIILFLMEFVKNKKTSQREVLNIIQQKALKIHPESELACPSGAIPWLG
jgi:hypothetical protein